MDNLLKENFDKLSKYLLEESKANVNRFKILEEKINSLQYLGIRSIKDPEVKKTKGIGTLIIAFFIIGIGYYFYPSDNILSIPISELSLNQIIETISKIIINFLGDLYAIYIAFNTKWF